MDWLVDKSALWKLPQSPDYASWIDRINRGRVWVGLPTMLEVAVSSRDADHWPRLRGDLLAPLLILNATPRSEGIAVEIMEALIGARLHRSVSLPDVLIAALAVEHRLTVLHDDHDFERIRSCTGTGRTSSVFGWHVNPVVGLAAPRYELESGHQFRVERQRGRRQRGDLIQGLVSALDRVHLQAQSGLRRRPPLSSGHRCSP
ncbi:PIN domain-containing protein [Sporichthya sp.]|uniref:PIN domain-containing protein n=1 Tax=Sporichthya sp. TaxID=65475 RepID=UPI0017C9054E|nr:PIN domain-containing protein [Sporichthya sp.]MBA3744612.1 PIN domain-containing protein [Sporichthya sp.]